MNKRTKSFLLSILTLSFIFYSCSNLANDLQKRKNQNLFNITIQETSNGTVTAAKSSGIKAGEEVILNVTATSGYELKTISVTNTQNKDVAVAAMEQGTSYKFTMPNSDVTVSAIFEKQGPIDISNPEDLSSSNGNTLYRIEHYQQDVDDLNSYTLYAVQRKRGEAGEETEALAQNYPGFYSLNFSQKQIESDGTTIVEIYYDRKTITYTFNTSNGVFADGSNKVTLSGLFGSQVDKAKFEKAGYTVSTSKTVPDTFGSNNEEFTVYFRVNLNTPYTVRVYYQETTGGDNYFLHHELYKYGTTDTSTNFDASSVTGFILKPYEQKNIDGDGSCVLNIYYDRISYTVTYELNGGSGLQSEQLLYGASPSQIPVKEGYTFWNWYYDSECETVFRNDSTQDTTLYAFWQDNSITYQFTDNIIRLPAGTDGTAGTDAEYVLFGDYPQSIYYSSEVEMIKTFKMGNITTLYGDDGNLYVHKHGQGYLYKVEPIKWRVISKDENGNAFLFAEKALERSKFAEADFDGKFENSIVHKFLNTDFLENAFTASARNKIQETEKLLLCMLPLYENEEIFVKAKVHLIDERELKYVQNFTWNSFDKYTTAYALGDLYDRMVNLGWFVRYMDLSCRNEGYFGFQIYVTDANGIERPRDRDALIDNSLYSVIPAITVYLPD